MAKFFLTDLAHAPAHRGQAMTFRFKSLLIVLQLSVLMWIIIIAGVFIAYSYL